MINVVYAMTHHVYHMIVPSLLSLIKHNPDARVFILCEDDTLDIPVTAEIINVTGQEWFPETGKNYHTTFKYINLLKVCYPLYLPVDKVIHLDIDTIVCENLQPMFDIDLTGKWFAATPEYRGNYRAFGPVYYNMGVAVINLEQMRKDNIVPKMIDLLNNTYQPYADQNAWNKFGIQMGKVVEMPLRYNENKVTGYTSNPAIVHYCGYKDWWTNEKMHRVEYLNEYR